MSNTNNEIIAEVTYGCTAAQKITGDFTDHIDVRFSTPTKLRFRPEVEKIEVTTNEHETYEKERVLGVLVTDIRDVVSIRYLSTLNGGTPTIIYPRL